MRKNLLFLLVTLILGSQSVFAQKGRPCVDEYKQDRTLAEMREILMMDGPYYDNLRIAYAEAINYNIGKMVIYSSKKGICDLLDNTIFMESTFVKPGEFQNGVRYGNTVRFTNLAGQPSKYYAAMHYCGKDYIYAKVACINPQKAKTRGIFEEEQPKQTSFGLPDSETGFVPTVQKNMNNSSFTVKKTDNDEVDQKQFQTVVVKTWFGKNWWWTSALVGIGTGFVAHKKGYTWYKWFPYGTTSPHGTMSGGRSADAAETATGGAGGRGN